VNIEVFDVVGRRVRSLYQGSQGPGEYRQSWNRTDDAGRGVAQGIYIVRLAAADAVVSRKLAIVR
jgi:hypothetical protein